MSEESHLQLVSKAMESLKNHWIDFDLFHVDFYGDESFGVNCIEKKKDRKHVVEHCFYSGYGIGDLLGYCKSVIENPSEAYRDR